MVHKVVLCQVLCLLLAELSLLLASDALPQTRRYPINDYAAKPKKGPTNNNIRSVYKHRVTRKKRNGPDSGNNNRVTQDKQNGLGTENENQEKQGSKMNTGVEKIENEASGKGFGYKNEVMNNLDLQNEIIDDTNDKNPKNVATLSAENHKGLNRLWELQMKSLKERGLASKKNHRKFFEKFGDKKYMYGYSVPDGAQRMEARNEDGIKIGKYSYHDPNGKKVIVHYKSDSDGFQVISNNLPQDSPIVAIAKKKFLDNYNRIKKLRRLKMLRRRLNDGDNSSSASSSEEDGEESSEEGEESSSEEDGESSEEDGESSEESDEYGSSSEENEIGEDSDEGGEGDEKDSEGDEDEWEDEGDYSDEDNEEEDEENDRSNKIEKSYTKDKTHKKANVKNKLPKSPPGYPPKLPPNFHYNYQTFYGNRMPPHGNRMPPQTASKSMYGTPSKSKYHEMQRENKKILPKPWEQISLKPTPLDGQGMPMKRLKPIPLDDQGNPMKRKHKKLKSKKTNLNLVPVLRRKSSYTKQRFNNNHNTQMNTKQLKSLGSTKKKPFSIFVAIPSQKKDSTQNTPPFIFKQLSIPEGSNINTLLNTPVHVGAHNRMRPAKTSKSLFVKRSKFKNLIE